MSITKKPIIEWCIRFPDGTYASAFGYDFDIISDNVLIFRAEDGYARGIQGWREFYAVRILTEDEDNTKTH